MTAPDPGLTDLIAAHQLVSTDTIFHRNGMVQRPECECGELMHWAGAYPAHVALVVEQHTNGRTAELEAENMRLRAELAGADEDVAALRTIAYAALEGEQQ